MRLVFGNVKARMKAQRPNPCKVSASAKINMSHHTDPASIIPCPIPDNKIFRDLTGQTFERLYVEAFAGKRIVAGRISYFWTCQCVCGQRVIIRSSNLTGRATQSCGCLARDISSIRHTKHGKRWSVEYRTWHGIMTRCYKQTDKHWPHYGGRGIKMCERWMSFQNFYEDMGPRPNDKHSIDRINTDGNYEPGNCRWATAKEQGRNRRNNKKITFNGETLCVAEWEQKMGVPRNTISSRIRVGWSTERALTEPRPKDLAAERSPNRILPKTDSTGQGQFW